MWRRLFRRLQAKAVGLAHSGPIAYRLVMPNYHVDRADCTCFECVVRRSEPDAQEAERERVAALRRLMGEQFDTMTRRLPS